MDRLGKSFFPIVIAAMAVVTFLAPIVYVILAAATNFGSTQVKSPLIFGGALFIFCWFISFELADAAGHHFKKVEKEEQSNKVTK